MRQPLFATSRLFLAKIGPPHHFAEGSVFRRYFHKDTTAYAGSVVYGTDRLQDGGRNRCEVKSTTHGESQKKRRTGIECS